VDVPDPVRRAAETLRAGGLVAFPTETVYGLGVDAENAEAVRRMYSVKNRPPAHPVIVHLCDQQDLGYWAPVVPGFATALMQDYWPGPMTLILPRSERAKDFITGGQENVGLRVPQHPLALALLRHFRHLGGNGVAAPSANRYRAVSPTNAQAVRVELHQYLAPTDVILDGGNSDVGVESTIIDCTRGSPIILRPGAITAEMIEETTRMRVTTTPDTDPRVPGSHQHHYSPKAQVLIGGVSMPGEGLIAGDDVHTPPGVIRLSAPETAKEYARTLYWALREADRQGLMVVRVVPPSGGGLAIAIRDRILRSAAQSLR
jgi:L-threonylcarbamoyladenylate synthase